MESHRNEQLQENSKMLSVTRIHKGSSSCMAPVPKVLEFIRNAMQFADSVLICIGNEDQQERMDYVEQLNVMLKAENFASSVTLLPISPWGHFTTALNGAVQNAVDNGFDIIAFQSLEFRISPIAVTKLMAQLHKPNVFVVGPAITGHEFSEGRNVVRGRSCPWNTFALWIVESLSMTGFPPVGDGHGPQRELGGVEEVTAINLIQHLRPNLRAVLVRIEGINWETNFTDPDRAKYHENKMLSKDERPAHQMNRLGIPCGHVLHVIDTSN